MAYVHCHHCGWSQDDFYKKDGYNPAKSLLDWNDALCSEKVNETFPDDPFLRKDKPSRTYKEVIAEEFERCAKNIRNMHWTTWEQYKNDPHKGCPKCGKGLCID